MEYLACIAEEEDGGDQRIHQDLVVVRGALIVDAETGSGIELIQPNGKPKARL